MSRFRINVHATYGPSPSALSLLRGDMPPVDTGEVCRRVAYSLTHERVYLDKGLSLAKLSSIVGTNTTYLSNAVNDFFGCNLKTLINWCRVQHERDARPAHLPAEGHPLCQRILIEKHVLRGFQTVRRHDPEPICRQPTNNPL